MINVYQNHPAILVSKTNSEESFVVVLSRTDLQAIDVVSTLDEFWTDEETRESEFSHICICSEIVSDKTWDYWFRVRRTLDQQVITTRNAVKLVDKMQAIAQAKSEPELKVFTFVDQTLTKPVTNQENNTYGH